MKILPSKTYEGIATGAWRDFISSVGWLELCRKMDEQMKMIDAQIENPDTFTHGKAVGTRAAFRMLREWPERLLKEAER